MAAARSNAEKVSGSGPRRLLLISLDPVGPEMRGLGIRYRELARALAPHAHVTLASPGAPPGDLNDVDHVSFRPHAPGALRATIAAAEVIVAAPQWHLIARWMTRSGARLIWDLYDPESLETLELFAHAAEWRRRLMVDLTLDRLHAALTTGHQFICASEKQRDLWLGAMLGKGLLQAEVYDRDPTLRSLIDTVPFGVPDGLPQRTGAPGPRELINAVGPDDEIVLWNGGIWNWLDAPTAIGAVGELAARRPSVRLVFMGASDALAAHRATEEARDVARRAGLLDRVVVFHDRWVPYDDRVNWLLDSDCALVTHRDHLETRFAFRTRMLDCLWTGLPIVCTAGDALSERVADEGLGAVAAPGDVPGVASAIERVLERGRSAYEPALHEAGVDLRWSALARRLLDLIDAAPPPRLHTRAVHARNKGQLLRELVYRIGHRALDRR